MLWLLSLVWLSTAAVRGLLVGHDTNIVLFSTSSLIGLFGARALVAGCDPARLSSLLRKPFVVPLGALVLLLMLNSAGEPRSYLGTGLGGISVDTASVFVALGTFVVLVEWSSRDRHKWALWATVPLFVCPFTIEQRATLVHLGATVLVIGWAMTRPEWRSRIQVPRVRVLWGVLAVVAVLMVVLMVQLSGEDGSLPFAGYYEAHVHIRGSAALRSGADARPSQWGSTSGPMPGYTVTGSVTPTRSFDPVTPALGNRQPSTTCRWTCSFGPVSSGSVLFVSAFLFTIRDGIGVWRRHTSGTVAALALAAVTVMVSLGLKSVFESILEKGKLALVIGLSAGVIAAALRSLTSPSQPLRPRPVPERQGEAEWI